MLRYTERRKESELEVRFFRLFEALRLVKKWAQFQSGGIFIVTRVIGVQVDRKWFDRSYIYGFGYGVNGHGRAQMLQFNYSGEGQIVLADNVQKGDVEAFLKHLHQEGFDYNPSWQRPTRSFGVLFG